MTDTVSSGTPSKDSAVIKIDHIPFGFFEREIANYFSQFGGVVRVRVPRCRKSGRDRGYAFVQFDDATVAQVAMEAMDGYLMYTKRIKVTHLKEDQVPNIIKKGAKIIAQPNKGASSRSHVKKMNKEKSEKQEMNAKIRRDIKMVKKMAKLAGLGLDYDMDSEKKINNSEVYDIDDDERCESIIEPTPKKAKQSPKIVTPKEAIKSVSTTPKGEPTPKRGRKTPATKIVTPKTPAITPPLRQRLRSAKR